MAVGKEIRTKIKSVQNTRKITKAMEMVAASKMRKAQERMLVLGIGVGEMRRDVADLVAIGPRRAHPLLRLAHLGGGDHFHRLGDLARVLHALDLGSDFLGTGHSILPIFVIPAKAGIQGLLPYALGPRLRGDDNKVN